MCIPYEHDKQIDFQQLLKSILTLNLGGVSSVCAYDKQIDFQQFLKTILTFGRVKFKFVG